MDFYKENFDFVHQYTLTVDQEEAKLLHSITEFMGRKKNPLGIEMTEDEREFAENLANEIASYIDEDEALF